MWEWRFVSSGIRGLVATQAIAQDAIIDTAKGLRFPENQFTPWLSISIRPHVLRWDNNELYVVFGMMALVRHSATANCQWVTGANDTVSLQALQAINAEDELTVTWEQPGAMD